MQQILKTTHQHVKNQFGNNFYPYDRFNSKPDDALVVLAANINTWFFPESMLNEDDIQQYIINQFSGEMGNEVLQDFSKELAPFITQNTDTENLNWQTADKRLHAEGGYNLDLVICTAGAYAKDKKPYGVASVAYVAYSIK